MKAIVEENGGEYQGKFIRAEVTHLVLGVPKGDKYSAAKKLSHVKVVKLAWIEESVTKGYLLPEEEFSWKNDSAQTPSKAFPTTRSAITQSASNAFIVEDTMDKMGAMTFAKKEPSNVSVFTGMFPSTNRLQTQSDQSITSINNTQNMTTKEKTNTCAFFERFQSKSGANNSSTINKKMTLAEELKAILDKSTSRISSVFDGCVFFTVGCPTDLTTLLRKCVTVRGGYLFDELRNSTTHIVCGRDTSAKDHEMCDNHINKSDHNIFKFDFDWLLTCLRQNKLLNAPNSIASQSNVTNRTESQSSEYRIVLNDTSQIGNVAQTSNSTIQRKSRILMRMDESDKGEDDFLKDYLSQPSQSQLNTANLTRTVSISSPPAKKQQPTQNTLTGNGNEMRSMISTPQPEPQPSSSGLAMPSTSGINLTSSTNLIIPSTNRPENDTMSELSLSLSYNLQPAIGLPLQNCVITFSGYYESEREEYKKIARTLGAVCQDVFSLRQHSNQNIRANTHLICDKQEGPKYEKSLQWKVHSVDKQWLMDCQKHNRRMNESLYLTGQMTGTQSKNTFIEEVSKNDYDTLDSSSQFQAKLRTVSSYFLPPAPLQPCTIDEPIRPINILPQTKTDDSLQGIPIAWNDRDAHVRSVPNKDDDVSQFSFSRNPLIMLCGLTVPEKLQFSRIIDRLGGRLADDKETRHDVLVTCDTTKNEKFFTSLCTGKWIVHPDFLTKSADAGHFLSPQQFEWGTNKELTARLSPSLFDCAQACPRWRDEVARMGHGAFNRHHVVVVGIRPSSFVTIINSGGGRAREVKVASKDANSYAIIMKSLTAKIRQERSESRLSYILIDYPRSLHKVMRQLALPLHELGVCCAPVEYISHYLLLYPSPQVRLYDISQCEEKLGIEVSRSGIRKRNSDTDEASTPSKRAKN